MGVGVFATLPSRYIHIRDEAPDRWRGRCTIYVMNQFMFVMIHMFCFLWHCQTVAAGRGGGMYEYGGTRYAAHAVYLYVLIIL